MKTLLLTLGLLFCVGNNVLAQKFINKSENLLGHGIYLRSMDVQTADLNDDGFLDIVLAIEWAPNVILWGNEDGKFYDSHSLKLSKNLYDSEDVAIADFNNDGLLDLGFAAEDDQNHEYYINKGRGYFEEVKNKFPKFTSNAVIAHDFNKDGFPDLLFGNQGQNQLFLNDGQGNFSDKTSSRLPKDNKTTQDIAFADVDNNGTMDLIIGNEDGYQLWMNQGKGYFKDETAMRFATTDDIEIRKVVVLDVNNDGYKDLFFCTISSNNTKPKQDRLLLNNGSGKFFDNSETHLPKQDLNTFDAIVYDVNKDGSLDLVLVHMGNQQPSVLINDKTGKFTLDNTYLPDVTGHYISILGADFNNDGALDIYLGGFMSDDKLLIQDID